MIIVFFLTLRRNSQSWRLEPRFHTTLGVSLVGDGIAQRAVSFERPSNAEEDKGMPYASSAPFADNSKLSGVLRLSRAGFNLTGNLALLYYDYRCGALCGQSGWVVLHESGRNWQVRRFGSGVVYY